MATHSNSTIYRVRTTSIRAGDVVTCIEDCPCRCENCIETGKPVSVPYRKGDVFRVISVEVADSAHLHLKGVRPARGHKPGENAARFRKVKPATADFATMIRSFRREDA